LIQHTHGGGNQSCSLRAGGYQVHVVDEAGLKYTQKNYPAAQAKESRSFLGEHRGVDQAAMMAAAER